MKLIYLVIPLAPLLGAMLCGFLGKTLGRKNTHRVAILGVLVSFLAAASVLLDTLAGERFEGTLYEWASIAGVRFQVGFLIDNLTATMMCVVTFVSLMVHIYTIGYMHEDPGYQRFFSYISLFTFAMLMLVMSNNFVQLFFGWEAVGLISYLLIGFWFTRPTAIYANLKAFLVNRVGDFGFALGIGLVLVHFGSLDYAAVFAAAPSKAAEVLDLGVVQWPLLAVTCICLFIGAMGKSAQFPLHVWLPDSMEGPTPISALIHAATMVTAGIFMVARMSPLFELSDAALAFVMVIGSITALFMGFLGIVQNDIKRVVAYSTLSQLGYMTVALGASAYSVAIFHLMTHAFFKALLFLAAGSVIMGLHHDQDMRNMGGLRKYMPITWITSLIGSLALIGTPFLSGFYSKDSIIEAVGEAAHHGQSGAGFAYFAVLAGVFVTAFYSFRMVFLVFHGSERFGQAHGKAAAQEHGKEHGKEHGNGHDHHEEHHGLSPGQKPHESPWVVTVPLMLLALPSLVIGAMTIEPMLFGKFFDGVIAVDASRHPAMAMLKQEWHGAVAMGLHSFTSLPLFLAASGVACAWYLYLVNPALAATIGRALAPVTHILEQKYFLDRFNDFFFSGGARLLGRGLWKGGDQALIDGAIVNGSWRLIGLVAAVSRGVQTGYLYHYAIAMIVGVAFLMFWFVPLLARG
jgi:NADH-quinone oxidoreductase subunit L